MRANAIKADHAKIHKDPSAQQTTLSEHTELLRAIPDNVADADANVASAVADKDVETMQHVQTLQSDLDAVKHATDTLASVQSDRQKTCSNLL